MPSNRQFYRTVYQIEVLSETPLPDPISMERIEYEITVGDCSGRMSLVSDETVDGPATAELLLAQGSDPEFFRLDGDGNELDEDLVVAGEAYDETPREPGCTRRLLDSAECNCIKSEMTIEDNENGD